MDLEGPMAPEFLLEKFCRDIPYEIAGHCRVTLSREDIFLGAV